MKYKKFIINMYRGIVQPLIIDLDKNSLMPLIGINESGKTTILNAILAFDWYNDDLDIKIHHLTDVHNLSSLPPSTAEVSAEIILDWAEFKELLEQCQKGLEPGSKLNTPLRKYLRKKTDFIGELLIKRNLKTHKYNIISPLFDNTELNDLLCKELLLYMPFILYFDDFRDDVPDKIKITKGKSNPWLSIIDRLFKSVYPSFSIHTLAQKDEREKRTIISAVERYLNNALTKEWENFKLDDKEALKISIDFSIEGKIPIIRLNIIEKDANGDDHFYYIKDRSKGFYWFFNFVMKVEFNPKIVNRTSIFLLDEPGSYLHASAQAKLCKKLEHLSESNVVIYCTHSHYLLNPDIIPLNSIRIVEKESILGISIKPIHSYIGLTDKKSAFQPILDALQIKPFMYDYVEGTVLITEGIYDYYAFEMFKGDRNINIIPAANAKSIRFFISMMIAWGIDYYAIWDNDDEGKAAKDEATKFFGEEEAVFRFKLLPSSGKVSKRILQNLFDGTDLTMIRNELNLNKNCSFEKTILYLFFSKERQNIIRKISTKTLENFAQVFDLINNTTEDQEISAS